jgi:hypothetical protein
MSETIQTADHYRDKPASAEFVQELQRMLIDDADYLPPTPMICLQEIRKKYRAEIIRDRYEGGEHIQIWYFPGHGLVRLQLSEYEKEHDYWYYLQDIDNAFTTEQGRLGFQVIHSDEIL